MALRACRINRLRALRCDSDSSSLAGGWNGLWGFGGKNGDFERSQEESGGERRFWRVARRFWGGLLGFGASREEKMRLWRVPERLGAVPGAFFGGIWGSQGEFWDFWVVPGGFLEIFGGPRVNFGCSWGVLGNFWDSLRVGSGSPLPNFGWVPGWGKGLTCTPVAQGGPGGVRAGRGRGWGGGAAVSATPPLQAPPPF